MKSRLCEPLPMAGALTVGVAITLAIRVAGLPTHLHLGTVGAGGLWALGSLYPVGPGTWRATHAIPRTFSPSRR